MTRRKKTRSLADKVTIRTGKRKDYRRWRHDNPDEVAPSRRYVDKKTQQRKLQAERKRIIAQHPASAFHRPSLLTDEARSLIPADPREAVTVRMLDRVETVPTSMPSCTMV